MCSHLSCISFVWQDAFCFCVPKMSSTPGDSPSGNGKRPVKRGKGQGTLCHTDFAFAWCGDWLCGAVLFVWGVFSQWIFSGGSQGSTIQRTCSRWIPGQAAPPPPLVNQSGTADIDDVGMETDAYFSVLHCLLELTCWS